MLYVGGGVVSNLKRTSIKFVITNQRQKSLNPVCVKTIFLPQNKLLN